MHLLSQLGRDNSLASISDTKKKKTTEAQSEERLRDMGPQAGVKRHPERTGHSLEELQGR